MKKSTYRRCSKIEKDFCLIDDESELFNDDEETKMKGIEAFIELSDTNEEIKEKYGYLVEEYFNLPEKNKKKVCRIAYRNFTKTGVLNIDEIFRLIACEAEDVEEERAKKTHPVVAAIQENNKLYSKRPNIDFSGMKYDI